MRGSQAEKWGCTAYRGSNQRAELNIEGMGQACGVGRRKVAAHSLGAHGPYPYMRWVQKRQITPL
eukprot:351442-Chlamydomonas_euryale.AAC.10